ncbi:DUF3182 family protein [Sphingomonas sp. BK580]|uniref:DUF3182 family protein n=1 Tax=Sphingomonas sp. BK580 TaxID=2586972 RepID=UPI001609DBE8|nr:DUF3182 family protein [Sphingomonas sp. BK580]MBB3691589.1 hypothetical protein [Sphingomonas sp. BK580]
MPSASVFRPATVSPFTPGALPWQTSGVAALVDHARPAGNVHDRASRAVLLRRIAALLDQPLLPPMDAAAAASTTALLVPGDALLEDDATAAGIFDRGDILGGVVPAFFVGTKAISHGLVGAHAARPRDWTDEMAHRLGDAALPGYTAFSRADAAEAGRRLLHDGPVRIKDVCGKAGLGQEVVRDAAALDAALALEDDDELARCGIVLEQNLTDVVTYSVGVVELGGATISYWGSQNLTRDHHGREVYGGSDLTVVRGGLKALRRLDLPAHLARAVACAARFDAAAHASYPGLILTRRNYDVIEGVAPDGERRTGVLEQSWRVGGASGAEIAAFEAFRAEPDTDRVCCSTVEVYDLVTPPSGAITYYRGTDPRVGAMTKYAVRYA